MMKLTEEKLLAEMNRQNPWWSTGKIDLEPDLIKRDIYSHIKNQIDSDQITALVGLRRTGKTTILYQIISHLLNNHPQKNILYFSIDLMEKQDMIIRDILDTYLQNILKEIPEDLNDKVYIFFDEIQKVKEWGNEIKSIWDRKYPIKFFVSGSSSMNILKGSGESLVGRINVNKVKPFSFREYLKYHDISVEKQTFQNMIDSDIDYPLNSEKIRMMFNRYIEEGGFPETYELENVREYINDLLSLSFYRDIINLLTVKRPEVLEGLFHQFISQSGQVINYNHLADALDTRYKTIKSYIEYLEMSFLINKSLKYTKNKLKKYKKNPKIYISDHGFSYLENLEKGLKIETIIFNLLNRNNEVYYWSDDKEVDLIVEKGSKIIPIEVKYKENIEKGDLSGLLNFMDESDVEEGIVVSKNQYSTESYDDFTISLIPAWLFSLIKT